MASRTFDQSWDDMIETSLDDEDINNTSAGLKLFKKEFLKAARKELK